MMSLKPQSVNFDDYWPAILNTIDKVFKLQAISQHTWQDCFLDVYKLCVAPEHRIVQLHRNVQQFYVAHLTAIRETMEAQRDIQLVQSYDQNWREFFQGCGFVTALFKHMNDSAAKLSLVDNESQEDVHLAGIGELGMSLWKELILTPLRHKIVETVMNCVEGDRCGTVPCNSVVHSMVESLVEVNQYEGSERMKLYEEWLEEGYLQATGEFYHNCARELLQSSTCPEYMRKVSAKVYEEDLRSRKFLHPSSYEKVHKVFHKWMVADHLDFLHSECEKMVAEEDTENLSLLYRLVRTLPGACDHIHALLGEHIRVITSNSVKECLGTASGNPNTISTQFVDNITTVYFKFHQFIKVTVENDPKFVEAMDRAIAASINEKMTDEKTKDGSLSAAYLLSHYCDILLSKNCRGLTENELEEKLNHCIIIFRYVEDKDIYHKFYCSRLAKRLIYQTSSSMDAEEEMIRRLKEVCGFQYTSKLHKMFTDVRISENLRQDFTTHLGNSSQMLKLLNMHFDILVLQAGTWPISNRASDLVVPPELSHAMSTFTNFYQKKFSGRKLTWLHNQSILEMKTNYLTSSYFITTTVHQFTILSQFDRVDELSPAELCQATGMELKELTRHMQSLTSARLLLQAGEGCGARFRINLHYTNKRVRFNVTKLTMRESNEDVEKSKCSVADDRKFYIQAAIVRIMKARKSLTHTLLINEVISLSSKHFNPSVSLIKRCINILIEKQYIERSPDNNDIYLYIA